MRSIVTVVAVVLVLLAVGAALFVGSAAAPTNRPPTTEPVADAPPPVPDVPTEKDSAVPAAATGLSGMVLDPAGKPAAAGVLVNAQAEDDAKVRTTATTDAEGLFVVPVLPGKSIRMVLLCAEDPRTGAAAGTHWAMTQPGSKTAFTVLRLRPTCAVTGRVIDGAGDPLPGARVRIITDRILGQVLYAWQAADFDEWVSDPRTDRDGRFRVLLPRRPGGRAAAVDDEGVSGPIRRFEFARSGETDLGDLPLANARTADWTLRFEDEAGKPVPDVRVYLDLSLLWHARVHPRDDPNGGGVTADEEGRIRMRLPCRTIPATLVLRSPTHRNRILTLDLRREGPQEATVRLSPHPGAELRITGGEGILPTVEYLSARSTTQTGHTSVRTAFDILTGTTVTIPEDALEWCRRMAWPSEEVHVKRIAPDRYELRAPPGAYRITLVRDRADERANEWPLGMVRLTVAPAWKTVDLAFPAGRIVTVDQRKLNAWAARVGARRWLTRYAAVPTIREELFSSDYARTPPPTELLGREEIVPPATREVWAPAGYDAISFGYSEDPVLADDAGLPEVVRIPDSNRVEAPVPEGILPLSAPIRIRVRRRGTPFRHAGVTVRIYGGERGNATFLTDGNGEILVHLFEGRYHVGTDGFGVQSSTVSDWPRFEVGPPFKARAFVLDFEFVR